MSRNHPAIVLAVSGAIECRSAAFEQPFTIPYKATRGSFSNFFVFLADDNATFSAFVTILERQGNDTPWGTPVYSSHSYL